MSGAGLVLNMPLMGIIQNKFTFDDAATWISQDKDTRNNHGLLANPQSSTSRFEMQQLAGLISQDVAKVVENMQIGEISKPFAMINSKGKQVCAIVKLKNRIDGHKATITEDYQRLKAMVTAKRSEEKLQKWIVEKQKNTYVRIILTGETVISNIRDGLRTDTYIHICRNRKVKEIYLAGIGCF